MNNISRISFLAETAGSPACLPKGTKASSPIVEKPTPRAETTGSPAYSRLGALNKTLNGYDTVSFRGETSGSPAYSKDYPADETKNNNVSFKSRYDSYQAEKSNPLLTCAAIATGIAVSAIVGLGYAYKKNAIAKMGKGTIKNIVEPLAKKCYEWCHILKKNAVGLKKKWF